jgi:SAM-dependent methyltransferase
MIKNSLKAFVPKPVKDGVKKLKAMAASHVSLLSPFYLARRGLFNNVKKLSRLIRGSILDVGCGARPYEFLFDAERYAGLELDTPDNRKGKKADFFYDGRTFPFKDSEFDNVIFNQVLEHVFNPDEFLNEVFRTLRPGGKILVTAPFMWDEHEQPFDYARYSSFGIRHLLQKHGFTIIKQVKSVHGTKALAQLINCYIYKNFYGAGDNLNLVLALIAVMPLNLAALLLSYLFAGNHDLYIDNIVVAEKAVK